MTTARALTICQPWCWLIANGLKDVENRSWRTRYTGRIWLHASWATDAYPDIDLPGELPHGVIIGSVLLTECVRDSASEWAEPSCWHWLLADARLLAIPVPARGRRGLWHLSEGQVMPEE